MAKVSEIVVAIEAEGVDAVLGALKSVEGAQASLANESKKSGDQQKQQTGNLKTTWQEMATGINQAMAIARQAIQAGKAVYDFSKEGAQLDYIQTKFGNLTKSIDTTSFALMNDLRQATQGTLSDAQLMEAATNMMSLGLADSHDEVVRLTNVAGEMGMNLDQLTLTLTNQTTRRFDNLGLSVAGFDEKLKALQGTGLSTQEAFTEAFLQQAEQQIERVGGIADTSAGSFMKLEAALGQIGANVKQNLSDQLVPGVEGLADGLGRVAEIGVQNRGIADIAKKMENAGLSTTGFLNEVNSLRNVWGNLSTEDYSAIIEKWGSKAEKATEGTQYWANANYEGAEAMAQAEQAIKDQTTALEKYTLASTESAIAVGQMSANYQAMALDFGAMQSMAYGYDEQLNLIAEAEARIAELQPFAETGGYLNGVEISAQEARKAIEELEGVTEGASAAMDRMAAEMTLSLMQASMEIDGYTEGEIASLLDFMVQAGLVTEQAAEKMATDYKTAIETANALELQQKVAEILADTTSFEEGVRMVGSLLIDNKTGKILADTSDYMDGLTEADLAELPPEVGDILANIMPYLEELANLPDPEPKVADITANYIDEGFTPNVPSSVQIKVDYIERALGGGRALGGEVYPGKEYMWQEPGREGELFIPETYGRVMNAQEVAMMVREAFSPEAESGKSGGSYKQPEAQKNIAITVNATVANDLDLDKLTREIVRRINL